MYVQTKTNGSTFQADLKEANELENQLKQKLESNWNCSVTTSASLYEGSFSGWDLSVEFKDGENENITIEVKQDKLVEKYGNVAVEYGRIVKGEWRDTCLSATKADVWAYYIGGKFYLIETSTLKEMVDKKLYTKNTKGGDGGRACLYIFPKDVFFQYATPLNK